MGSLTPLAVLAGLLLLAGGSTYLCVIAVRSRIASARIAYLVSALAFPALVLAVGFVFPAGPDSLLSTFTLYVAALTLPVTFLTSAFATRRQRRRDLHQE